MPALPRLLHLPSLLPQPHPSALGHGLDLLKKDSQLFEVLEEELAASQCEDIAEDSREWRCRRAWYVYDRESVCA